MIIPNVHLSIKTSSSLNIPLDLPSYQPSDLLDPSLDFSEDEILDSDEETHI